MSNPSPTPRLRFGLRWLFALMAIVAVALAMLSFPLGLLVVNWLLLVMFRGVLPTIAVVAVVFASGDWRAFALGALVALLPHLFGAGGGVYDRTSAAFAVALPLANVAICGSLAVAARRWFVRRGLANEL